MKHPDKPAHWHVERELILELPEGYKETLRLFNGKPPAPTMAYVSYQVDLVEHLDLFVTGVWVPEGFYRQGWGSWILDELFSVYPGWPVTLQAIPGRPGLSTEDLYTFYRKKGFVQEAGSKFTRPGTPGWKPLPPIDKGPAELRARVEEKYLLRRPS